jgi:hypothetical protein
VEETFGDNLNEQRLKQSETEDLRGSCPSIQSSEKTS